MTTTDAKPCRCGFVNPYRSESRTVATPIRLAPLATVPEVEAELESRSIRRFGFAVETLVDEAVLLGWTADQIVLRVKQIVNSGRAL